MTIDQNNELGNPTEEEVERFLELYRDRFKVERHDGVKAGFQIVLVGEEPPFKDMAFLRELLKSRDVELVIPALMTPEERRARQVAIVDSGHARLSQVLAKALQDMAIPYEAIEYDEPKTDPNITPKVVKFEPTKQTSFKHHQNQFKGKGPSTRRTFAQIRPPRRGGR